jgi:digeranylgeranylglycerophospholipid reductase
MIIIGGGSAGLFLAGSAQERTIVIEEHKKLGLPVQCTGILTDEIYKIIRESEIKKFTLNTINSTKVFSPNNSVELKIRDNLIIDNEKFIEFLTDKAERNDVKILSEHRYISNIGSEIKLKDLKSGKIKYLHDDTLIGADGPRSEVAKQNKLFVNKNFLLGIQARMKIADLEKKRIEFYPYIGEYAWSVPENDEISRVGIAVSLSNENVNNPNSHANKLFSDFLKKFSGKKIEMQAGLIPLHKPGTNIILQKKEFSAALVGDSAGQIKNTTGGGIIPGLIGATGLSMGINNYKQCTGKLRRQLYLHYILHRTLRNYNGKDWDRLIAKINDEKIKHALEHNNRDNILKLLLSLSKSPSMIGEGLRAAAKFR